MPHLSIIGPATIRSEAFIARLFTASTVARQSTRFYRCSAVCSGGARLNDGRSLSPGYIRAGTIVSHTPSATTGDDFLSSITTSTAPTSLPHSSSTVVLICTRAFGSLASDADFLQNFITRLAGVNRTTEQIKFGWSVNILSAVVDLVAKPPVKKSSCDGSDHGDPSVPPSNGTPSSPNSFEGISYLFDITGQTLGLNELSSTSQGSPSTMPTTDEQGHLSLRISNTKLRPNRTTTVQLPLANTLFVNGSPSTMVFSQWHFNNDSQTFTNKDAQSMVTFTVDLPDESSGTPSTWGFPASTSLYLPLKALTPLRVISDARGNVIRRLGGSSSAESATSPASLELEQAIAEHFKQQDTAPQSIPVWALVGPKKFETALFKDDAKAATLVKKGASVHRVLSGGGGWGENSGLISLDHRKDFTQPSLSNNWNVLELDKNNETSKNSFGGAIALPGDVLRFFISDTTSVPEVGETDTAISPSLNEMLLQIGVTGADSENEPAVRRTGLNTGEEVETNRVETFGNYFGALSESGFAVSQQSSDGIIFSRSKIDIPYARLGFRHIQPTKAANGLEYDRANSQHLRQPQASTREDGVVIRKFLGLVPKREDKPPSLIQKVYIDKTMSFIPGDESNAVPSKVPNAPRIIKHPTFDGAKPEQIEEWRQFSERNKVKARAMQYQAYLKSVHARSRAAERLSEGSFKLIETTYSPISWTRVGSRRFNRDKQSMRGRGKRRRSTSPTVRKPGLKGIVRRVPSTAPFDSGLREFIATEQHVRRGRHDHKGKRRRVAAQLLRNAKKQAASLRTSEDGLWNSKQGKAASLRRDEIFDLFNEVMGKT